MVPSRRKEERKSASDRNWVHLTAGSLVCSASSISMSYLLRENLHVLHQEWQTLWLCKSEMFCKIWLAVSNRKG